LQIHYYIIIISALNRLSIFFFFSLILIKKGFPLEPTAMATKKHSRLKTYLENTFIEFSQPESDRLRALYSDFSKLAILNKYAFDTNVSYWRQVILDCSQQGHLGCSEYATVINTDTIAEKFQRPVMGKPLALDTVLVSHTVF
jgi:hypothetical protein